jgi:hypothetical protein
MLVLFHPLITTAPTPLDKSARLSYITSKLPHLEIDIPILTIHDARYHNCNAAGPPDRPVRLVRPIPLRQQEESPSNRPPFVGPMGLTN